MLLICGFTTATCGSCRMSLRCDSALYIKHTKSGELDIGQSGQKVPNKKGWFPTSRSVSNSDSYPWTLLNPPRETNRKLFSKPTPGRLHRSSIFPRHKGLTYPGIRRCQWLIAVWCSQNCHFQTTKPAHHFVNRFIISFCAVQG